MYTASDHRCRPNCLVCAAELRAEATRTAALPMQQVREAWHNQRDKPRTGAPDVYTLPERFTLDEWRAVRLSEVVR